ncbi:MAG TPA: hypothetical protein VIG24_08685 [Acidimicrobiia bacterium]
MRGRNVKANNLYQAEDLLLQVSGMADALALELGVIADDIHFDGKDAPELADALHKVRLMRPLVDQAEGLLVAYEMMLNPGGVR